MGLLIPLGLRRPGGPAETTQAGASRWRSSETVNIPHGQRSAWKQPDALSKTDRAFFSGEVFEKDAEKEGVIRSLIENMYESCKAILFHWRVPLCFVRGACFAH